MMKTKPFPARKLKAQRKPRSIAEVASRLHSYSNASLSWLDTIELGAKVYLGMNQERKGATFLRKAMQMAQTAKKAVQTGSTEAAVYAAMEALQSAWLAELTEARGIIEHGAKMANGRKEGSLSITGQYIHNLMKERPDLSQDDLITEIFDQAGNDQSPYDLDTDINNLIEKSTSKTVTREQLHTKIYNLRSRHLSNSAK